jgi:hypothetical protein
MISKIDLAHRPINDLMIDHNNTLFPKSGNIKSAPKLELVGDAAIISPKLKKQ